MWQRDFMANLWGVELESHEVMTCTRHQMTRLEYCWACPWFKPVRWCREVKKVSVSSTKSACLSVTFSVIMMFSKTRTKTGTTFRVYSPNEDPILERTETTLIRFFTPNLSPSLSLSSFSYSERRSSIGGRRDGRSGVKRSVERFECKVLTRTRACSRRASPDIQQYSTASTILPKYGCRPSPTLSTRSFKRSKMFSARCLSSLFSAIPSMQHSTSSSTSTTLPFSLLTTPLRTWTVTVWWDLRIGSPRISVSEASVMQG
mmetsp:Transcript_24897/g.51705  ORF Transcript_24897/g.51705 Transcript_24897/m.51705 type:complete len:260 (-) Transcript_24897:62-841(-)